MPITVERVKAWVREMRRETARRLPTREILIRHDLGSRYFLLTTRLQVAALSVVAAVGLALFGFGAATWISVRSQQAAEETLDRLNAEIQASDARLAALREEYRDEQRAVTERSEQLSAYSRDVAALQSQLDEKEEEVRASLAATSEAETTGQVLSEEAARLRRRLEDARRHQDQMTTELDAARSRAEALALQARLSSEAKAQAEKNRAEAAIEAAQLRRAIEEQRQSRDALARQLLTAEERAAAAAAEAKTSAAMAEQTAALERRLEVARLVQESLAARLDEQVRSQLTGAERALARTGLNIEQLLGGARPRGQANQGGPLISLAPPFSHINISLAPDDVERSPQLGRVARGIERIDALRQVIELLPAGSPVGRMDISSRFGLRIDPLTKATAVHPGTDLRAEIGTPVRVMAPGVVRTVTSDSEYGNLIDVRHAFGVVTRYAHLSAIDVKVGDPVKTGQAIGKVGMTGRSTGAHLHYEVRIDNHARNPQPFLELDRNALSK